MHNVLVVHKEVANDAAEAQDEDGCHALEAQAQPNADHGCKATATAISTVSQRCTHNSHQLLQLPCMGPAWEVSCLVQLAIVDLRTACLALQLALEDLGHTELQMGMAMYVLPDVLAVLWFPAPSILPTRIVAAVAMPKGSATYENSHSVSIALCASTCTVPAQSSLGC